MISVQGRILIPVIITAILGAASFAQPVRTQTGRALDRDFRIGSGGYNAPVESANRFNSQFYITGQVTGLSRFRGDPGYFAANELRLNLPSATLRDFRRGSVGVDQVLEGSPYRPAPYFDRSSTAFGVGGITRGLTSPGTNMPLTATPSRRLIRRLYTKAVTPYEPIIAPVPGRLLGVDQPVVSSPVEPRRTVWRPARTGLLGIPRRTAREQLGEELFRLVRPRQVQPEAPVEPETPEPPERLLPETGEELAPRSVRPERPQPSPDESDREFDLPDDQDVYLDLLKKLRQREEARRKELMERSSPAADQTGLMDIEGPTVPPILPPPPVEIPRADTFLELPRRVELGPDRRFVIVHGLSGRSRDLFNRRMEEAAKKLKSGKFYDAVADYRLAAVIDPRNPLARVGAGLARFGAGEPLSAALALRRALELLPPLMETRLEILEMMDEEVVRGRLDRLDNRLAEPDQAGGELAFLSVFIHQNLGEYEHAKVSGRKLRDLAGDDELLQTYARYVLTGKRPTENGKPGKNAETQK